MMVFEQPKIALNTSCLVNLNKSKLSQCMFNKTWAKVLYKERCVLRYLQPYFLLPVLAQCFIRFSWQQDSGQLSGSLWNFPIPYGKFIGRILESFNADPLLKLAFSRAKFHFEFFCK